MIRESVFWQILMDCFVFCDILIVFKFEGTFLHLAGRWRRFIKRTGKKNSPIIGWPIFHEEPVLVIIVTRRTSIGRTDLRFSSVLVSILIIVQYLLQHLNFQHFLMILLFDFDDRFPELLLHIFFIHSDSSQHKIAINFHEQCEKNCTWIFSVSILCNRLFFRFVTPIFCLRITIYNSIESLV